MGQLNLAGQLANLFVLYWTKVNLYYILAGDILH